MQDCFSDRTVINLLCGLHGLSDLVNLPLFPLLIARIQFAEDENQLVEYAHGEGAGPAGRIENLARLYSLDEGVDFFIGKLWGVFAVGKEMPKPRIDRVRFPFGFLGTLG